LLARIPSATLTTVVADLPVFFEIKVTVVAPALSPATGAFIAIKILPSTVVVSRTG